ncbi:phosphotransferase (plasmid) [Klebsiella pneumoniae]|nr:phosphotransferase [Klebsiella pneumoniae]
MGSCAAPSAKGDDKFITTDYLQQCRDFSLDNLIFDEGKLIGCIDVGRVGIADRYQDLAILWNCLGEFSPSLQKRLFQKYGIDNPDMNKLQFHLMLDEFF